MKNVNSKLFKEAIWKFIFGKCTRESFSDACPTCSYAVATWGISILCDYKAATKGNMNVHKQYNCDQSVIQLDCNQCNVSTKQHKSSIWECMFSWNTKDSYIVVTSVTTKPHTSMLLGFINNQYTRISNLIVNNASTKQQKGSSESAHSIETLGD